MAKAPPNTPARRDRVVKRGGPAHRKGTLMKMDDASLWCTVQWDDGGGPRMCHLHEIQKATT